jgi:hypothetical protein
MKTHYSSNPRHGQPSMQHSQQRYYHPISRDPNSNIVNIPYAGYVHLYHPSSNPSQLPYPYATRPGTASGFGGYSGVRSGNPPCARTYQSTAPKASQGGAGRSTTGSTVYPHSALTSRNRAAPKKSQGPNPDDLSQRLTALSINLDPFSEISPQTSVRKSSFASSI